MECAINRQYRTCQYCGANIDYGERCDCRVYAENKKEDAKMKKEAKELILDGIACTIFFVVFAVAMIVLICLAG